MSLVNDALRRAKEAQQQAAPPPPSQMQFRPVEPGQQVRRGLGFIMPATLAVVALLLLVLAWRWTQEHKMAGPREVRAVTPTEVQTTAAPQLVPAPTAATRTAPPSEPSATAKSELPSTPAPGMPDAAGASESAATAGPAAAKESENEATNSAAIAPAPAPKPPPLRLQAIVFNPKHPSALINGKTLFLGDKLGDARVVAIDQDSATLVGAGQTNVLSLPE
jgi:cytoskeletal protein RodZ